MAPNLVFGGGGIGSTLESFVFTWDTPEKVSELLSVLKKLSILEVDSGASYPPTNPGNAETLLGESGALEKGFVIDSKVAYHTPPPHLDDRAISRSIAQTLDLLKGDKIRTLYANTPDESTSLEDTAKAFHKQFVAGRCERLGLCNYRAAELAEYFSICEEKGYTKPSVYQICYNPLFRAPEKEIIQILRRHNCALYAYGPLGGGFLTGKVTKAIDEGDLKALERTRWRGKSAFQSYVAIFDRPSMHAAVRGLQVACEAASPPLTPQEASLRWLMHHSALQENDGIILGAKTLEQLESNVADARKGPLSGDILEAVEAMWEQVTAEFPPF